MQLPEIGQKAATSKEGQRPGGFEAVLDRRKGTNKLLLLGMTVRGIKIVFWRGEDECLSLSQEWQGASLPEGSVQPAGISHIALRFRWEMLDHGHMF